MGLPTGFLTALAQAETGEFWTTVTLSSLLGIVALGFGFVQLRRARLLEDLPTSRIRSAAQGYVEFHGHARLLPGPEIRSPLSNELCCWWEYVVQQRRDEQRGGHSSKEWVTIERATSDELFVIDDGTGQCVVDPVGATVIPSVKRSWRGVSARPMAYRKDSSWFGFGDFRYTERLVRFGDWLYTLGLFQTQTASRDDDEVRDVGQRLAEWKRDPVRLLHRFDSNRDGKIDLAEWEIARRAAIDEVRSEHIERSIQPDLHVLREPRDGRPYILSTKTEHQLTRGMRWSGTAGVVVATLIGAAVAFLLVARGLP
ncbi:E3 ubiquitin ligase [Panacagrimonas perspica]|uniref:RING-type E3 ubiquitin transferase n=1 Tax=Panacagrimonas perspica TaxID=381431 RepID=A0A4R7NQK4_9GAMM|nr:GIDE domain-containing protein [Panacagrimonas perspica]TDU23235.1 E3 ubiquitin ligase [Panacagrimonas perspica]